MNYRIRSAEDILGGLNVNSVLDVGCRNCEAKNIIPSGAKYYGCDLFQNKKNDVDFVGDVHNMDFGKTFDCVIALDIVEHVDDPYTLMDKLVLLSDKYLLVSLPNIYDILHKYNFLINDTLGEKYSFGVSNSLDRHRWVMSYDEIHSFFSSCVKKYDMKLESKDLIIGENSERVAYKVASKLITVTLGRKLMTRTVVALFSK